MRLIQLTLGAGATQLTTNANLYASLLIVQDNAAANVRVGDNTVSATKGILLALGAPGGSATLQIMAPHGTHLIDYFLFGTAGNVIDILYETAQ